MKSEISNLTDLYKKAFDYYAPIREDWKEKEALILCKLEDTISKRSAKSQVFDPRLLTIISERMFRVMSQMPSGKVRVVPRNDAGKSLLMEFILKKYILPNASSQYDILTKTRLVDFYSHVYGSMPVLVDWVVRDDYIGPDFFIIPPRDFVPQPNKYSINECEYVFVSTMVSRNWLSTRGGSWNREAINKLLQVSKGDSKNTPSEQKTYSEMHWGSDFTEGLDENKKIQLVTYYTPDRWVTFAVDYPDIGHLRDIKNPHGNGKLPFEVKHSFPLIDRFWGFGEVERGQTLQMAINSLINLYLDGVKYSIFPPLKIDVTKVVPSTIVIEPGAKWIVRDMNAVSPMIVSPQGVNTFTNTYQFLVSALLNQAGTTDTVVTDDIDPAMGKTPAAINFLASRQNSRDAFDRFQMEKFLEGVFDRFVNLLASKQEKPLELDLFADEIELISKSYPDVLEMVDVSNNSLFIKPERVRDARYKYIIDVGSTYKREEQLEKLEIEQKMTMLMNLPNALEEIKQTGKIKIGSSYVDFIELFKRSLVVGGIQDWDKILIEGQDGGEQELPAGETSQEDLSDIQALFQEIINNEPK